MIRQRIPARLDLKLAGRTIARTPLLTATGILSLAIGITLAATAYGVVAGLMFARLDVPEGERIVQLRDLDVEHGWDIPLDYPRYERRRDAFTTLAPLAVYSTADRLVVNQETGGAVVKVTTLSPNGFDALGVHPTTGRLFTAADPTPDLATALVLGASLARTHFGSEQAALGRSLLVDNLPRTVVAVMQADFRFPHVSDAWIPASGDAGGAGFMAFGRLAPGASMESAVAEYAVIAARDREAPGAPRMGYRVLPFAQIAPNPAVAAGLWIAVAALVVLLLVSAANVANLLLARTAARGYEFAVRAALGASRERLIGQIGVEALAMTAVAAVMGSAGAAWALGWFKRAVTDLPYWVDLTLRWDVLVFVAVAAALATLLVSLLPAMQLAKQSLGQAMRDHAGDFRFGRFSSVLIAVELAIAVAFLGAIGSVGRGLAGFGFGEAEIPADRALVAQVYFGDASDSAAHLDARRLVEQIRLKPGVAAAAVGSHFPGNEMDERTFELEGDPAVHRTRVLEIGPGYFETLGARLRAGRDFGEREHGGARAAIVNARFAERYGLASAVGRRIRFVQPGEPEHSRGPWLDVVGVAPNLALNPGNTSEGDGVYLPMAPTTILRIAILTTGSPQGLVPALHAEALALETRPQVQWSKSLTAQMAEPVILFRSLGIGLVVLGGIALLLSGASVYALLSLRVTRQRREIAVRMALGASSTAIARTVLGRTLRHAVIGSAVGLAIALLIARGIASVPFEIGTSDGGGLGMTALVLATIAAAACAIPLGRALRLRPVELLRED